MISYAQNSGVDYLPHDVSWSRIELKESPTIHQVVEGIRRTETSNQNNTMMASQYFQKLYGNNVSNGFGKAIFHQGSYFVIGSNNLNATVTKLDSMGVHLWTTEVNENSAWADMVVNANGDIILVGRYGDFSNNVNNQSLIGRLDPSTGSFGLLQSYDFANQRESFFRIYNNPSPAALANPFYLLGVELENGSTVNDNVSMTTLSSNGSIIGFRKIYNNTDDEFFKDIAIENNAGGMIVVGDRSTVGVTYSVNNAGNYISGRLFNANTRFSAVLSMTGFAPVAYNHILAGPNIMDNTAHIYKVSGTSVVYSYNIPELTSITRLHNDSGNNFFAIGNGNIGGTNRPVLLYFTDNGSTLTLNWAKSFIGSETNAVGGYGQMVSSTKYLYTDTRFGSSGGFGDNDAFLSVDDATFDNCLDKSVPATLKPVQVSFVAFDANITSPQPPQPNNRISSFIQYNEKDICAQPCNIDFSFEYLPCGKVQFNTNIVNGQQYCWDMIPGLPCESTEANPMYTFTSNGIYQVCLSVIVNGQTCTKCHPVNITNVDNIKPIITCPQDIVLKCGQAINDTNITGMAVATDDSGIPPTITTSLGSTTITGCNGVTIRTFIATDQCGNSSSCIQFIGSTHDTSPPVISGCGRNVTGQGFLGPNGQCLGNITLTTPVATDNCSTTISITNSINGTSTAPTSYPVGQTIITWTAKDACGNMVMCNDTVNIKPCGSGCQGLTATLTPIVTADKRCCYAINLNNGQGPVATDGVCFNVLTPDWIMNTISLAPGYTFVAGSSSGSFGCIENTSGIPLGLNTNVATICMGETSSSASSTQSIQLSWINNMTSLGCLDTFKTECKPPIEQKDTCFAITNKVVECDPTNDYAYCVSMTITNLSAFNMIYFKLAPLPLGYSYDNCPGCTGLVYTPDGSTRCY